MLTGVEPGHVPEVGEQQGEHIKDSQTNDPPGSRVVSHCCQPAAAAQP